jgi:MFS family permease
MGLKGSASRRRRAGRGLIFALFFTTISYAVSQTLLIPSLPVIQRDLHTSAIAATSLLTIAFVAGAVTSGLTGKLADMHGKRLLLLTQIGMFCVGSLMCALGQSIEVLLAGRFVMGSSIGMIACCYSIVGDELPPERITLVVTLLGGMIGIGAAAGQATGGLVTDTLGWHWVFWISLIMGLVSLLASTLFVPESKLRTGGSVDLGGAALLAAALGAPLVGISQSSSWGWGSAEVLGLLAIGAVFMTAFVLYERRREDPLVHLPTLAIPQVGLTNLATFVVGMGIFGASIIMTQFLEMPKSTGYGFGADPTRAGLYLVPGLLMLILLAPVAAKAANRFGPKTTLCFGAVVASASLTVIAISHSRPWDMVLWPMLLYTGIAFAFGAMPILILRAVPAEHRAQSTSLNVVLRYVGSAIGVQLAITLAVSTSHGSALPTDAGWTHAFAFEAAVGFVAAVAALAIPTGRGRFGRAEATARVADAV